MLDVGVSTGKRDRDQRELRLRRLMARQHGLIHRGQALEIGFSASAIHRRVACGAWVRHYRSVYGVAGSPATLEQRGLAACLATGHRAALSHTSAAAMWGWCHPKPPVHVTVPGQVTARPSGVVMHRSDTLRRGDVGQLRSVPLTSPVRTLVDLATLVPEDEVDAIVQRAVAAGCILPERLRLRVRGSGTRRLRGGPMIERLVPETERRSHVPTPLERSVAAILDGIGATFMREHPVFLDGRVFYLDFAFPSFRVAVEADGRRWHSDAQAFERDREKHNALTDAGWRVVRVTERQVRSDPEGVRDRVRSLIVRG